MDIIEQLEIKKQFGKFLIGYILKGHTTTDEALKEIFDRELKAYKEQSSDAEGRIIDYFSTQIHYSGNNLKEVVAEVNTLLAGMKNDFRCFQLICIYFYFFINYFICILIFSYR